MPSACARIALSVSLNAPGSGNTPGTGSHGGLGGGGTAAVYDDYADPDDWGSGGSDTVGGGLESLRCDLTGLLTRDEYLRVVADSARALGPGDWVLGGGWSMEAFPGGVPVADDLTAAAGGRPEVCPG